MAIDPPETNRAGRAPSARLGGAEGGDVPKMAEAVVVEGDVRETTPADKRVEEAAAEVVVVVGVIEGAGAELGVGVRGGGEGVEAGEGMMGAPEVRLGLLGTVLGAVLGVVLRRATRRRKARGGRICTGPGRRSGR